MNFSRVAATALLMTGYWVAAPLSADSINTLGGVPAVSSSDSLSSVSGLAQSAFGAGSSAYAILDITPEQQFYQQWSSSQNLALTSNLMNLILSIGGDNSLISQLFLPGAVFASLGAPAPASQPLSITTAQAVVPEPATMVLLAGGLMLLTFYAAGRVRKIRRAVVRSREPESHGPLPIPDRHQSD